MFYLSKIVTCLCYYQQARIKNQVLKIIERKFPIYYKTMALLTHTSDNHHHQHQQEENYLEIFCRKMLTLRSLPAKATVRTVEKTLNSENICET